LLKSRARVQTRTSRTKSSPAQFPVIQAEFVISAVSESDFPQEGIPEVVFAGRSNVGKSSLINRLAGHARLARTSSDPGKTRSINFYRLDKSFFFVDLPGFGYAKAGKLEIRLWKKLIEQYFRNRSTIVLAIQIVDSRMPPTRLDLQLSEWLDRLEIPRMLVATKSDKLSNNQKSAQVRIISDSFGGRTVVMASAATGAGCKEIWKRVLVATSVIESSSE
jgi:GTP-binding protein